MVSRWYYVIVWYCSAHDMPQRNAMLRNVHRALSCIVLFACPYEPFNRHVTSIAVL